MPDPRPIISKDTLVPLGVLVGAITATAFIVFSATNANSKIDLLTANVTSGFATVNTRLQKIELSQDGLVHDFSSTISRISVLEAQMKEVQSAQRVK